MRRLREDGGFTAVAGIAILFIVLTFSGSALALGLRRLSTADSDRSSARALAAADAGADIAGYRLNRALVSQGTAGLLGLEVDTLRLAGCLTVDVTGVLSLDTGSDPQTTPYCPPVTEQLGDGTSVTTRISTGVKLLGQTQDIITRRALVTGQAGTVRRRILVTYKMQIDSQHVTTLFRRWRYVECTPQAAGADPAGGCPDPGT